MTFAALPRLLVTDAVRRSSIIDAVSARPVKALLGAAVVLSAGALTPVPPVRAVVALPLALLVPGYAVVLALTRRRAPLDAAPLLALALLLSMAFYPLLALALHVVGLPLSPASVLAGTDVVVLALAALAHGSACAIAPSAGRGGPASGQDHGASADALPADPSEPAIYEDARFTGSPHRNRARAALWGLGAAMAIIWAGVGLAGVTRALPISPDAPYTAFYLFGRWARPGVVRAAPGRLLAITIGVTNYTGRSRTYRLSPVLDRTPWRAYTITVVAGGTWNGAVGGRLPVGGCLHRLSLTLHQQGSHDPLRPLVLWVRPPASATRRCAGTV